ncbi:MAG: hypothetical protein ABJH68_21190 [Ilumatobacter sp.]|uniref:hypothetical protein n=1 Tax=Ilumatobacter sp. TaxID=1967498 RepID=UPI003299C95E
MRQVLTLRFVAAIAALALLAVGVDAVFASADQQGSLAIAGPSNRDADGNVIERRIDVVESARSITRSEDFEIGPDGRTVGVLDAVLDEAGLRVLRVAPGTPGEISCGDIALPDRCVVLADVLGEAVVWFAILPKAPRETVEFPPIVDLQEGYALFENGWEIPYPPVIDRDSDEGGSCAGEDIPSFSDFLRRFGPNSTTIVDLETRQVSQVRCGGEYVPPAEVEEYDGDLDATFVPPSTSIVPLIDPDVEAPDG